MPPFGTRSAELIARAALVEQWLLPGECLLCHEPVERGADDPLVCAPCRSRWTPLPSLQCHRCGQPVQPDMDCRICPGWPDGFGPVRSAVWLEGGARRAVHLFKYEGWWRVAEAMARAMRPIVRSGCSGALVPIPLGASRQRSRGYNQSAVLATALHRLTGVPVAADVLRRGRETTTQTALTPEARRANLAGAFRAAAPVPSHAILVDDVFTTGATLAEAAAALLEAGARVVEGVTFARAPRPLAGAVVALMTGTSTEEERGA